MYHNIASSLDRADQLVLELGRQYDLSLKEQVVSDQAVQITHEICEKLRGILDRCARRYWELRVSPNISAEDRAKAVVYFPISDDEHALNSTLGRWRWKAVVADHLPLRTFLLALQPFWNQDRNRWLKILNDLAVEGKHIDLVPQRRLESRNTTVRSSKSSVSWNPSNVTFGTGPGVSISIAGAPFDGASQTIFPTPGVSQTTEVWVSFLIPEFGIEPRSFCKVAAAQTRQIAVQMSAQFNI
jgi:hypothetical protein